MRCFDLKSENETFQTAARAPPESLENHHVAATAATGLDEVYIQPSDAQGCAAGGVVGMQ